VTRYFSQRVQYQYTVSHGGNEEQTGEHDAQRPTWYAWYMMRTLGEEVHEFSGSTAP
jgi:hypothetical protein